MGQTKRHSWMEAWVNVAVGSVVALGTQLLVFPRYGIHIPFTTDLWLTFWFTLVSLARSYVLRRCFNKVTLRKAT